MATRDYYIGKWRTAQKRAEDIERRITRDFARLRKYRAQEKRYQEQLQISDEDRARLLVEKRKRATERKAKRLLRRRAFAAEIE